MGKGQDKLLIMAYRWWCEERFAASFLGADAATVSGFRYFLENFDEPIEDYEQKFLDEYKKQESEEKTL